MTALVEAPLSTAPAPRVHAPLGDDATPRPRLRATVRRPRLLAALGTPDAPPFVVLVAPAGYGKTTLLCEWCARDPRPFAWVTLDGRHDDPGFLLRSIARAVDEAFATARDGRIVLVFDDVQMIASAAARETLSALAAQPPEGMTVAFASRAELPLPVARLRTQGLVTELRPAELAMTRTEAGALFKVAGLQLDRDDVDVLLHRTEGWPAGLALAALSLGDQAVPGAALGRFGGGDRLVAEYLRDEVFAGLPAGVVQFIRRTSILDVLTAPMCDAILEQSGSAGTIAQLLRSNFPLVALDRTAERYRYHRLVADMMRAELHRTQPEVEVELHRRASEWHARSGVRELALRHALAADEVRRAGDLVWADLGTSLEQGSSATVEHWLTRFTDAQLAAHPRLALAAAGMQLAYGQGHLAEHWVRAAASETPATGETDEILGGVTALRAALGRDGLARMSEDAASATALLAADSPCQPLCRLLGGVAEHLRGDRELARRELEEGARRAAVPAPQIHALCLSQLALLALDDNDSQEAAQLTTRARSQVTRYGLDRYPTSALVLAVSALVRAQRGRVEEANGDLRDAAALLERLTDLAPWYVIEVQIVLARAALRLSDVTEARARLASAARPAARLPEAVVLHEWLAKAEAHLAEYTRTASRLPSSLTTAELRILQFLPTHLSFREIAERAYVSANTVKTQANAVYRKLDVRSRSEAVACARQLGLLDP
jgi:LuxR family maltose regulon positive regulatory protein